MDFPSALAILASPGGHAVPRAEAESIVQAVVNDPSRGIQALCHALECDGTRRLAAVLLSTAAARHWSVLGDDAKAAMRQRTLAALSRAEDRAEMRALVHAADTLASRSADDGSPWHELLPALDDAAKSARATHREAAVILLGSIVESTGAHMNDHHAALVALFAARLDDPVREVAAAATRALGTTALALQRRGDFLVVADLLPRILTACVDAAARRLDRSDDEAVAVATDAIAAAASVDCDVAFGSDASLLPRVVDVLVGIGTDPRLHPDGRARAAAFDALGCLAASHPGLLDEPRPTAAAVGAGTTGTTVTAVTAPTTTLADEIMPRLCAAAAAAGVDFTAAGRAEGEAESGGFAAAARSTLRRFSLHLPPAVVLPHVVAPLDAALIAGAAPSPGALACLAAVTEGCASDLAEDPIASNVIASVAAAMEYPDPASKVAAALAFKELAEHAGHALTELFSHAVIPTLVAAISLAVEHETEGGRGDAAESFVAPTHAAASALCANFGSDEIAPALPGVIPPLLGGALGGWRRGDGARGVHPPIRVPPRTNPRARARCLDTLERFAHAAAWEFEPFASDVVAALATLATTNGGGGCGTDDRDDEGVAAVRFRALAAMATVIAAVGEESAPPGAVDSILSSATLALSAGSSEDAVARECAFRCFGRLATVLERSLAPWLGGAIAAAAATLAAAAEAAEAAGFQRAVSTGGFNESIAAAEALGALVNSCGFATRPHLAVALAALGRAASSPSSPVALRVASARSLEFSLRPLEESDDGGGGDGDGYEKSAPGDGDDAAAAGGARDLAAETVALLARLVTEDEEPEVALAAATSLEESAAAGRRLGAAAAAATTAAAAAALLDGSARCQAGLAEGEGGDDGEDAGTVFFDLEDQARRLKKSLG